VGGTSCLGGAQKHGRLSGPFHKKIGSSKTGDKNRQQKPASEIPMFGRSRPNIGREREFQRQHELP
jgi:hypothetical protein